MLQPAETQAMIYSILTQRQRERLESEQELDGPHAPPPPHVWMPAGTRRSGSGNLRSP